jgi:hypothetical protein
MLIFTIFFISGSCHEELALALNKEFDPYIKLNLPLIVSNENGIVHNGTYGDRLILIIYDLIVAKSSNRE